MLMLKNKLLEACVSGNTIVLKPSPHTPLTTTMFAAIAGDAFPPGVVNVLPGSDARRGAAHRDVATVSFTGSVATGKAIAAAAAPP
ncbi:aldehyde dehydrogenase [Aureococcus anophagefferens]|nr:aldehyde dehydrogenase [Aureococcus anophagefferens]